jgi:hypothetical protein
MRAALTPTTASSAGPRSMSNQGAVTAHGSTASGTSPSRGLAHVAPRHGMEVGAFERADAANIANRLIRRLQQIGYQYQVTAIPPFQLDERLRSSASRHRELRRCRDKAGLTGDTHDRLNIRAKCREYPQSLQYYPLQF